MSIRGIAKILSSFAVLFAFQSQAAPQLQTRIQSAPQIQTTPRTVFIQLFEWPWEDVARECEIYLGPAGFSAVQVSPPHEHIMWQNHPWWERYQVVSYNLNSRGGNEKEFANMVRRCQAAGVDVYVDAVLNHATGIPGGKGFGGTDFSHYNYPGIYSYSDFHHCNRNGNDDIRDFLDLYEVQNCELLDLADLATESEKVRNTLANYLNHLLDLGVAGFRIDATKHIPARDLKAITSRLKRPAYIYQEIIYDPRGPVQYSDYLPVGDVMAYDYPRVLAQGFQHKNTYALQNIAQGFPESDNVIVFATNHDLERTESSDILSYNSSQQNLYRLAQIFMLAWPYGYPQLYSGYRFSGFDEGPPLMPDFKTRPVLNSLDHCNAPFTCEHRLKEVAVMVDFRNQTDKAFQVNNWWSNNQDVLAFSRGMYGFVAINFSKNPVTRDFSTAMPNGNYCNILDASYNPNKRSCSHTYQVRNKTVTLTLPPMTAMAFLLKTSPQLTKK